MKVRFIKQTKKDIGWPVWGKTIKVLYIALYWFGIQISFGKKPFDALAYQKFLEATFNKNCKVCGKPLLVTNVGQRIYYHRECRHLRSKIKHVEPIQTT